MLVGTALVFEARKLDWRRRRRGVGVRARLCARQGHPAPAIPTSRRPGSGSPRSPTAYCTGRRRPPARLGGDARAVARSLLALRRRRRPRTLASSCSSLAWMLTSEIATTVGVDHFANQTSATICRSPLNWVDLRHARPAGDLPRAGDQGPERALADRVLEPVDQARRQPRRLGARARARPGTPDVVTPDGRLSGYDQSATSSPTTASCSRRPSSRARTHGTLMLYRKPAHRPWRLLDALQQVYSDGWCPEWCSYTYFKPNQRGDARDHARAHGFARHRPAGPVRIRSAASRLRPRRQRRR